MTKRELPTPKTLRKLLRYKPDTGKLFWRERMPDMFKDGKRAKEWKCNNWNSRFAGKEAFTAINVQGYKVGAIFDMMHRAHRVIWAMETGEWPEFEIDHKDHDRANNIWDNLKDVTHRVNQMNATLQSNNTSGVVGVYWDKSREKWMSSIKVMSENKYLGRFDDIEGAVVARKKAEIKYGFHKNHGKTA